MAQNVQRLFTNIYGEEKAKVLDKALTLIDRGMVDEDKRKAFFLDVLNLPAEKYAEIVETYHRPRKQRTLSEEQKQKSFEKQLEKLKAKYGITENESKGE